MIKAVLFDFDDTIVKTKEIRYKALKKEGKKFYNLDITDDDIDKHWGKPFESFISELFNYSEDIETLTRNHVLTVDSFPNESFPHTKEVIDILASRYLLAIISSSIPELILSGLGDVKIDPKMFFFIQSSKDTNAHKPSSKVFLPTINKLKAINITKDQAIYIGDSLDDYVSATKAGFHFCGIANRTTAEKDFIDKNAPYVDDIQKLPKYITNTQNIVSS